MDEGIEKYELTEKQFNKAKQIGRTKLFVIIKIIGFLFFTTHLIKYIYNKWNNKCNRRRINCLSKILFKENGQR